MNPLNPFHIGLYTVRPAVNDDLASLRSLVPMLYREDGDTDFPAENIERTFDTFEKNPHLGIILIIELDEKIIGYTIIATYYSNEYGGTLVCFDEVFVLPEHRGKGIGTNLLTTLMSKRPFNAVGCWIEVSSRNKRASDLYERLGFKPFKYNVLMYEYPVEE